jgi:endodeoxyribonuclease RusA
MPRQRLPNCRPAFTFEVEFEGLKYTCTAGKFPEGRVSQAAALAASIRPTSRPDTDNHVKAALDAINGIVVTDDCLVVELAAEKRYARLPQLRIVVTPLPATAARAKKNVPIGDGAALDLLELAW